eukprot:scaffold7506_cov286-Pinguiococcus_pyrenoidosus.AAC.3
MGQLGAPAARTIRTARRQRADHYFSFHPSTDGFCFTRNHRRPPRQAQEEGVLSTSLDSLRRQLGMLEAVRWAFGVACLVGRKALVEGAARGTSIGGVLAAALARPNFGRVQAVPGGFAPPLYVDSFSSGPILYSLIFWSQRQSCSRKVGFRATLTCPTAVACCRAI